MNRHFIGLATFLAAIIIGAFAGTFWWTETTRVEVQPAAFPPPIVVETINAPSDEDPFEPEFRDLPNFGEPDDESASVASNSKLIDTSGFQSPDEKWPSYSQEDLIIRSGERWLGLYASNGEMHLASTKVIRSPREGYIGPGDQPYDWLKYERKGELVFLVKNVPALRPGNVPVVYNRQMWDDGGDSELSDGYRREFVLGSMTYILRTSRAVTRDGSKLAVLVLEHNGKSQVIDKNFHWPEEDRDIIGSLIWAGDLDGDGRLDLYTDLFNEKGSVTTRLHLSTSASDGKLVGTAATFSSAGC